MARGFLSGALLGGAVCIGAAAAVSVLLPAPQEVLQSPQVSDAGPDAVQAPPVEGGSLPVTSEMVTESAPEKAPTVPQAAAPATDTLGAVEGVAVATIKAPETGAVAGLAAPSEVSESGGVAVSSEDPVLPNPQALAPMLPQEADGVSINTAPAEPPKPKAPEVAVIAEPTNQDADEIPDTPAEAPQDVADNAGAAVEIAEADLEETAPPEQAVVPAVDPPAIVIDEAASVEVETAEIATTETTTQEIETAETVTEDVTTEQAGTADESAVATDDVDAETEVAILTPSAPRQIGTPAISLTDRAGNLAVNRLGTQIDDAVPEDVTVITDAGATGNIDDRVPLVRFAQPFANAENKPLMSIVLIDDGSNPTSGEQGIAALRSFPYTLNFAVDSSLPDAAERMALYRGEGFEVLAMVDLPEGAQPTDVETTLGSILPQMREVVGILEGTAAGLQGSRSVSDQVTAILAQSGHGLVTQDKGLNTMPKLARKEGVPADPVFRDFDSKDQTATVIRRFLDQAAFKAGQEGAVIMLGRLRPDTISALLLWGLQDRAGKVALAPISAVLTRDEG